MAVFCVQMCQVYVIQLVYLIYTYALGSRNTFSGSHTVSLNMRCRCFFESWPM